uniref:Uncharacterized protein n=1 Tax=Rhizophora mucronata TaxID=61149 RepID=A0A2P2QKR3_RHIMU
MDTLTSCMHSRYFSEAFWGHIWLFNLLEQPSD